MSVPTVDFQRRHAERERARAMHPAATVAVPRAVLLQLAGKLDAAADSGVAGLSEWASCLRAVATPSADHTAALDAIVTLLAAAED